MKLKATLEKLKDSSAILKSLLSQCTEQQQMLFKRMYSHKNLTLPIDDVVDNMDIDKIDHAIKQCQRTVSANFGEKGNIFE